MLLPRLPEWCSVLRAADNAQAWSFAANALTPFRWKSLSGKTDWAVDASIAKIGALSLIHMHHHGASLHSYIPSTPNFYDVHFALSGESSLNLVGRDARSLQADLGLNEHVGAIISPHMPLEMLVADGYEHFHVRIERAAVDRYLERTLQRPIIEPVRFDPTINLGTSSLTNWVRAVALLVDDIATESGSSASQDEWAQLLISKLLSTQPSNYTNELERRHSERPLPRGEYKRSLNASRRIPRVSIP